jgi:hypothetical protein
MKRKQDRLRLCSRCHQKKPEREFYPNSTRPDGRSLWCIKCTKPRGKRGAKKLTTAEASLFAPTSHKCVRCLQQIMKRQAYGVNTGGDYYHLHCGGLVSKR